MGEKESEGPPLEEASSLLSYELLHATSSENTYSVTAARFVPDGDSHTIVISFDERQKTVMSLAIDDEKIYEVDTERKMVGIEKLRIDGMVVEFLWSIYSHSKMFLFFTRAFSPDAKVFGEPGYHSDYWVDHHYIRLLKIVAEE